MTSLLCMQCENPPCVDACPIPGAIYSREDGKILIGEEKCNGCRLCVPACPYGALYFREDKGVVDKCTFCFENIDQGLAPECVRACPSDAMLFGDLDNPESQVSKLIRKWDAKPLHPEHGTKPSAYYTAHAARVRGTIESKKTGHVVQGATVTLKCADEEKAGSTITDSDGVFFFWDLKIREKYSVSIEANGFSHSTHKLYIDEEYTDLGRI